MSGVLVDTSVWINHIRKTDQKLNELLLSGLVRKHPMVEGELSLGTFKNKKNFLIEYSQLKELPIATHAENLLFADANSLSGQGVGWIDTHLLASCALGKAKLYSVDSALKKAAETLGLETI